MRVVDVFVDNLDLTALGFDRAIAQATGRPGYHPATLLKSGRGLNSLHDHRRRWPLNGAALSGADR